jgi:hypothetical protein
MAPAVGFEPTTNRLTADRSTTELRWILLSGAEILFWFMRTGNKFFGGFRGSKTACSEGLKAPFGARNPLDARVELARLVDGAGEAFEDGLGHVVGVAAVEDLGVEIAAGVDGEGAQEFLDELEGEEADRGDVSGSAILEVGAPGEIDDDARQGLVHGEIGVAVAADAALIAEGAGEGLAEDDSRILDGVVQVDLDIAIGIHLQIDQPMAGEEDEHVVEERDLRADAALAGAVDREIEPDPGFAGITLNLSCAGGHRG